MQQIEQYTALIITESDMSRIDYTVYGSCPKCKSPVIKGKAGYGCSKWREGCSFVIWKEYNGKELDEDKIRLLLQKKILLQGLVEGMILSLSDSGNLMEIPVPTY